jgi:hypothetical protein
MLLSGSSRPLRADPNVLALTAERKARTTTLNAASRGLNPRSPALPLERLNMSVWLAALILLAGAVLAFLVIAVLLDYTSVRAWLRRARGI